MKLSDVVKPLGMHSRRRVGRGIAAGQGKTAGRGTKGQGARSGHDLPRRFEGGQTPLTQRLPKLNGFRSIQPATATVRFDRLEKLFADGAAISAASLRRAGLVRRGQRGPIKVVASRHMAKQFRLSGLKFSQSVAAHLKLTEG